MNTQTCKYKHIDTQKYKTNTEIHKYRNIDIMAPKSNLDQITQPWSFVEVLQSLVLQSLKQPLVRLFVDAIRMDFWIIVGYIRLK